MSPVQTAHAPLFTLRITDTRNGRSQSADVRHALTLIGTREGCWIRPRSSRLSPVHCAIVHTGDVIVIRDLVSDGGTFVNASPVDLVVIRDTDQIKIGYWEFVAEARGGSLAAPDRDNLNRWIALIDVDGETVFESDAPVVLVGSNVRCDFVLNDRQASAAHALIVRVEGQWAILDLLTSHGTHVNEQPIDKGRRLNPDDMIQIGSTAYRVALRAEPNAATSPPVARETEQLARERDELAKRREELNARSAALDSNTEALLCQSESIRTEQQQLQEQHEALEALRQTVQSERDALRSSEEAHREGSQILDERASEAQQREADLEHRKTWVDELAVKLQADNAEFDRASEQFSHDREALATQQRELDARWAALASREEETQLKCESLQVVQQRLQEERDAQLAEGQTIRSEHGDLANLQQELEARASDIAVAGEQLKRQSESLSAERRQLEQQRETQEALRANVHSEQQALGRWEEELRQKERMLTTAAEKLRAEFIALRQRARAPDDRLTEGQLPEVGGNRHGDEGSSPRAALVDRDWLEFFTG